MTKPPCKLENHEPSLSDVILQLAKKENNIEPPSESSEREIDCEETPDKIYRISTPLNHKLHEQLFFE